MTQTRQRTRTDESPADQPAAIDESDAETRSAGTERLTAGTDGSAAGTDEPAVEDRATGETPGAPMTFSPASTAQMGQFDTEARQESR